MRAFSLAALPAMIFLTVPTSTQVDQHLPIAVAAAPEDGVFGEPGFRLEEALTVDEAVKVVTVDEVDESLKVSEQDLRCLALNIYHEARSEPEAGQIAVALVTLNRVASKSFPSSICAVVKQGGKKRNRCQFSWWCDGRSDRPKNKAAWLHAMSIARRVLDKAVPDPTKGALYYHASYCNPSWSSSFRRTARIGQHLFYRPASI